MSSKLDDTRWLQQDEEICFTGFVMDRYCIDRGNLFDLSSTRALEEPNRHSIHCLVDVDRCVGSGYQMLVETPNEANLHCRAFELDSTGNYMVLQLARSTGERGFCETCTGGSGSQVRGFRATVFGKIRDPTGTPPLKLEVTRVESASVACPNGAFVPTQINCDSGDFLPFFASHGSLMLISWGFLLPFGVLAARFLRKEENALWFKIHRLVQPLGLLLALTGWIVAFASPFDVLGSGIYDAQFAHGLLGTIVMILGTLQPINAYFRPHLPENEEETPSRERRMWEIAHKSTGYIAVVAGIVNCFIGMALSGKFEDYFFIALVASVSFLIVFAVGAYCRQRHTTQSKEEADPSPAKESDEEGGNEVEKESLTKTST